MIQYLIHGGGEAHKLPLLILSVVIVILSGKKLIDLFIKKGLNRAQLERGLNAIIFWGGISALFGLFDHYLGLFQAIQSITPGARSISPSIVALGYAVSVIKIYWGLLNLFIAAIFWFIFRWRIKKITPTDNKIA